MLRRPDHPAVEPEGVEVGKAVVGITEQSVIHRPSMRRTASDQSTTAAAVPAVMEGTEGGAAMAELLGDGK
jgi:hypothetical protein